MVQEGVKFLYNALPALGALGGAMPAAQDAEPFSMPSRDAVIVLDDAEPDALADEGQVMMPHLVACVLASAHS